MGPIYLFDLTSRANQWLSVRQSTIAENVANSNTPGFKPQDVKPFQGVLDQMSLSMSAPNRGHIAHDAPTHSRIEQREVDAGEVLHSGNSVSIEREMIKAGEVNRAYALNTSILKTFHRMLMMSSKG